MGVAASPWPALLGIALSASMLACGFNKGGLAPVEAGAATFADGGAAIDGRPDGGRGGSGGSGGILGTGGTSVGGSGGDAPDMGLVGPDARDAGDSPVEGGGSISVVGCSDGTREGYVSEQAYPRIAACAGGWEVAGLLADITRTPTCERQGGNSGPLTDGSGCTVADLCAEGWHVCETAKEVADMAGDCDDATTLTSGLVFYVTRQRAFGSACISANNTGTTNLHGCGNIGTFDDSSCDPFQRMMTNIDCTTFAPWRCASSTVREYEAVTKRGSTRGGVLCCRD